MRSCFETLCTAMGLARCWGVRQILHPAYYDRYMLGAKTVSRSHGLRFRYQVARDMPAAIHGFALIGL